MAFSDTVSNGLSLFGRLWEAGEYCIACLIGLLMILWGIFLNGGDWLLTGAGAVIFLAAGWYTYQALTAKGSG